jgi:hypothetical protein
MTHQRYTPRCLLIFCALVLLWGMASAQSVNNKFIDPEDGKFDISGWLDQEYGILPLVIPITEPALGFGGVLALSYFHPKKEGAYSDIPSSVSALGGLYTTNKSWGVFGGHFGYWRDDRIRYEGGGGYFSINLASYAQNPGGELQSWGFKLKGLALDQKLTFRIADSDFFLGAEYLFFYGSYDFGDLGAPQNIGGGQGRRSRYGGFGPVCFYDSRDNTMTPNRGIRAFISYLYFAPAFGSETTFHKLSMKAFGYTYVHRTVNLGLRGDAQFADEDTPFFMLPFIQLRGIPAMRYQGKTTYLAEAEVRWDFTPRWSLIGFAGYGEAIPVLDEIFEKDTVCNYGLGGRYLIARRLGLRLGIDIARGPEEWAFYIVLGSGWSIS